MKRSPQLLQLSREHHTALVLAKRAQRLGKGQPAAVRLFVSELGEVFTSKLEPHFQVEEIALLSALREVGPAGKVTRMVERALVEHGALRELARRIDDGDFASLTDFGDLLEAHVRFEERELFDLAESLLSAEALARVDAATQSARGGCCSTLPS